MGGTGTGNREQPSLRFSGCEAKLPFKVLGTEYSVHGGEASDCRFGTVCTLLERFGTMTQRAHFSRRLRYVARPPAACHRTAALLRFAGQWPGERRGSGTVRRTGGDDPPAR